MTERQIVNRIGATVLAVLAWILLLAAPAAAHGGGDDDATNYLSRITSVDPEVPGIEFEIIENGDRVQLTNNTEQTVIVYGYALEEPDPYLRITPTGVEENLNSQATYINRERQGDASLLPSDRDFSEDLEPEWSRISDSNVARWHDHRVHHMGSEDPPAVREAPDERHVVNPAWVVPYSVGETDVEVTGELIWVPGPSPWPWVGVAILLFAVAMGLSRTSFWRAALAALTVVLIAADVMHAVGSALVTTGGAGSQLVNLVTGTGFVSAAGWVSAGIGAWLLLKDREQGLVAVALGSLLLAVNGGLGDLSTITRSQILFEWSTNLARTATVIALGLGAGLFVATALRLRERNRAASVPAD